MGLIEQISQMKERGLSEREILEKLQEQGISPKSIVDAIEKIQVKKAITQNDNLESEQSNQIMMQENQQTDYYQSQNTYNNENQSPTIENTTPQQDYFPQEYYQEYPQQENYQEYPQEEYLQQNYPSQGNYNEGISSEKIIEISNQVFNEKIKKIKERIDELIEFKTINQTKIDMFSERLKKVESTIDQLQAAILKKIGAYGGTLESIKEEMSMMRNSFVDTNNKKIKAHKKILKKNN